MTPERIKMGTIPLAGSRYLHYELSTGGWTSGPIYGATFIFEEEDGSVKPENKYSKMLDQVSGKTSEAAMSTLMDYVQFVASKFGG